MHSETQRGKSLVDAHFALTIMHVNRFCNDTRQDVTTPSDIVRAFNSFGGAANCTAELVCIHPTSRVIVQWLRAHDNKKLVKLRRVNEIIYSEFNGRSPVNGHPGDELRGKCYNPITQIFNRVCVW